MTEQTSSDSGEEQVLSFRKRLRKFLVDSIGKLILIFLLLIAGSAAMIFHWGGFLGGPLVHASIRFMFGMESSWDSLHIDWLEKKIIIENLVIYQPEGFNKEVFFRASLAECELNMYSGTEEFNIKKLAVHDPEFIWEFNGRSDSMRRFFEYLHSGKKKKQKKYKLRIDTILISDGAFELYDYVTVPEGVHIGIRQVQSEMKNISNYHSGGEALPAHIAIFAMLRNSKQRAVSPVEFKLNVNLITYAVNFKASINAGGIDLRILDPYCVDTMGLHLTAGTLGIRTVKGICTDSRLTTRHVVNLDNLDFEPCEPGESDEEPWLNLVEWVKRLDAPEARHEFTVDLNGTVGQDARLELSTSDMTIRVVFEKLADAFDSWFNGTVQLKRRKRDPFRRR